MLNRMDDYMIHQIPAYFGQTMTTDRRWFDRYWSNIHLINGELTISQGLGVYLNTNVMDAFSILVRHGKTQYSVRASREMCGDPEVMTVGPIHSEILEPLKRWRLWLDDNPYGFSYDLEYEGIAFPCDVPGAGALLGYPAPNPVMETWCHFNQSGRVTGWVKLEGQTIRLTRENCYAARDRSWGVREGVGGQTLRRPTPPPAQMPRWNWVTMQFPDRQAWYMGTDMASGWRNFKGIVRYVYGDPREETPLYIVDVEREVEFTPGVGDLPKLRKARLQLTDNTGTKHEVLVRPLTAVYLKDGWYGTQNVTHGVPQGPLHVEGGKRDLTDPATMKEVMGLTDHVSEYRWGDQVGYGIFEVTEGI